MVKNARRSHERLQCGAVLALTLATTNYRSLVKNYFLTNVFYKRAVLTSEPSTPPTFASLKLTRTMPQPQQALLCLSKNNIQLTILSITTQQIRTERATARTFNVPRMTLRDRRAGKPPRHDCQPNSKKLTQREEEVIVSHILSLDQRGSAPTYSAVRDMADKLLAARGAGQVGVHWPRNFVKRTDSLTTRFNRAYDRQRALCEDPALIRSWFELVD